MIRICSIVWQPRLRIYFKRYKQIMTHDETEMTIPGDWVQIRHVKRVSKWKRFAVDKILTRKPREDEITNIGVPTLVNPIPPVN